MRIPLPGAPEHAAHRARPEPIGNRLRGAVLRPHPAITEGRSPLAVLEPQPCGFLPHTLIAPPGRSLDVAVTALRGSLSPGRVAVGAPFPARGELPHASALAFRAISTVGAEPTVRGWLGWHHYRVAWLLGRPSPTSRHASSDGPVAAGCDATGCGAVPHPLPRPWSAGSGPDLQPCSSRPDSADHELRRLADHRICAGMRCTGTTARCVAPGRGRSRRGRACREVGDGCHGDHDAR